MEIELISVITRRTSKAIEKVPEQEWPAIYDSLNSWKWDSRLGNKPADWDEIPNYSSKKFLWFITYKEDKRTRTKYKIIAPIMLLIENTIGRKAILRYHHTHNLHRTDQQFEDWWDSERREKEWI